MAPINDNWDSETYSKIIAPYASVMRTEVVELLDPKQEGKYGYIT